MSTAAGERSEADHEEVETRKWDHVDGKFAKIRIELTGESEAGCHTRHDGRDEVVEVAVGGVRELERTHADIVESLSNLACRRTSTTFDAHLIVNTESLVRVLNELMYREGGVVWLDDGIRDLGRWDNREGCHHAVWELFANLGDQQCSHTSTSTPTE